MVGAAVQTDDLAVLLSDEDLPTSAKGRRREVVLAVVEPHPPARGLDGHLAAQLGERGAVSGLGVTHRHAGRVAIGHHRPHPTIGSEDRRHSPATGRGHVEHRGRDRVQHADEDLFRIEDEWLLRDQLPALEHALRDGLGADRVGSIWSATTPDSTNAGSLGGAPTVQVATADSLAVLGVIDAPTLWVASRRRRSPRARRGRSWWSPIALFRPSAGSSWAHQAPYTVLCSHQS